VYTPVLSLNNVLAVGLWSLSPLCQPRTFPLIRLALSLFPLLAIRAPPVLSLFLPCALHPCACPVLTPPPPPPGGPD
jgi:hypothetical protein